ncbi:hypothetical protein BDW22DRAFT_1357743 [Trametopsis cervina]|nr:hypothetical protein BDW22DRAFT_1357743 [Trametopsis cervina]
MPYEPRPPEAIPLIEQLHDDDDVAHTDGDGDYAQAREDGRIAGRSKFAYGGVSWLTIALCALLFTACLSSILSLAAATYQRRSGLKKLDVNTLRRPSVYMGLERVPQIQANGLTFGATIPPSSDPPVLGKGSEGGPRGTVRVSEVYPRMRFVRDGWVVLSEHDHTILNFTIPPGPGTQCVFRTSFPARASLGDALLTLEIDSPSESPLIGLVLLYGPLRSSLTDMTWATRPPPVRALGELRAAFGENSTGAPFACGKAGAGAGGEVLVEAYCAGRGCRVEYDAMREGVPIGLILERV